MRVAAEVFHLTIAIPGIQRIGDHAGGVGRTLKTAHAHVLGFAGELASGPACFLGLILKEIEVPLLTAAFAAARGKQIRAADLLGLNRNTLRKKIRYLDIQVYRSGG